MEPENTLPYSQVSEKYKPYRTWNQVLRELYNEEIRRD